MCRELGLEYTVNNGIFLREYIGIQCLSFDQTTQLIRKFTLTIQSSLRFDMPILLIVTNGILRSRVFARIPSFVVVARI